MPFFLLIENVKTELDWLTPAERWDLFLEPLTRALAQDGFGKVVSIESAVEVIDGRKAVVADEIVIEVSDAKKGNELLRRIEQSAKSRKGLSENE